MPATAEVAAKRHGAAGMGTPGSAATQEAADAPADCHGAAGMVGALAPTGAVAPALSAAVVATTVAPAARKNEKGMVTPGCTAAGAAAVAPSDCQGAPSTIGVAAPVKRQGAGVTARAPTAWGARAPATATAAAKDAGAGPGPALGRSGTS